MIWPLLILQTHLKLLCLLMIPATVTFLQFLEVPKIFQPQAFVNATSPSSNALMFFALLPTFHIASSSHLQILSMNVIEVMLGQPTEVPASHTP